MVCLEEIQKWDLKEESVGLVDDKRSVKKGLKMEFNRILALEEVTWCQKSRVQWLKEGDSNTKFFDKMVNARWVINSIDVL